MTVCWQCSSGRSMGRRSGLSNSEKIRVCARLASSNLPEGRKGFVVPASISLNYDPSVEATFSD